ncbi:MAG: COX15/CtaA family protein, partial [Chloroflexota bacterium]
MNIENKTLRHWLLTAAILTFVSLMIGYAMRFNPVGQGCPDFPTCYGQLNFPQEAAARVEMAHRLVAALSGLITLGLTIWVWVRQQGGWLKMSLTIASIFFLAQLLLGAGLVGQDDSVWMGVGHLAAALLTMAMLSTALVVSFVSSPDARRPAPFLHSHLQQHSFIVLLVVFALMISGVLVARLDAGSACSGFPLCEGGLPVSGLGWLALGHRLLTLLAAALAGALFLFTRRAYADQPLVLSSASALIVLFGGQAL